jgi:hypothetical protein
VDDPADLGDRPLMPLGELARAVVAEQPFDPDLAVSRIQGAGGVKQGQDDRVMQPGVDAPKPSRDAGGRAVEQAGDSPGAGPAAEGQFDQQPVFMFEELNAFEESLRQCELEVADVLAGFEDGGT